MKNQIDSLPCLWPPAGSLEHFHRRIEEKTRDTSAPPVLIIALGDSVTGGAGLPGQYFQEEVYHAELKRLLQRHYPLCRFSVIDAGDDGRDAPSGVHRLERDVLHHQPDLLLVAYGLNDAAGGGEEGIERYGDALAAIINRTREASPASIVLLTPNMMPSRVSDAVPEQYRNLTGRFIRLQNEGVLASYAQRLREVADYHGIAVADVYRAWERLQENGADTTAMLVNGLNHPGPAGHRLAAECIMSLVLAEELGAI